MRCGIARLDGSAVNANDAIGNGKTQTGAAGFAIAIVGDAVERLEDVGKLGFGNTLPIIADEETDEAGVASSADSRRTSTEFPGPV